jgi:hypothetical protein
MLAAPTAGPKLGASEHRIYLRIGFRDAEGGLAKHGLGVDAPFSGEDPVGVGDHLVELNGLGDDLNAGLGFSAQILK